tara:strand:- start:53 stop:301 length:249 start_codon:yes stop_codon:yes gene_type:complete
MDLKVNKAFFIQTCTKIIDFLDTEHEVIIQELKNMINAFDLLSNEEQLNIWSNLHKSVKKLPEKILQNPIWTNIYLSDFKLK